MQLSVEPTFYLVLILRVLLWIPLLGDSSSGCSTGDSNGEAEVVVVMIIIKIEVEVVEETTYLG